MLFVLYVHCITKLDSFICCSLATIEVEESLSPLTQISSVYATDPEDDAITYSMEVTPMKAASFVIDPSGMLQITLLSNLTKL